MTLTAIYQGKPLHPPPLQTSTSTIGDLRLQISTALHTTPSAIRLICLGKTLTADHKTPSELAIPPHAKLLILHTPVSTQNSIKALKPDPLIRPFSAPTPRFVGKPRSTSLATSVATASRTYGFATIQELSHLPDSHRAREILTSLANDAGFLQVMRRRAWRVGALKEMMPDGKVGVDPVCVLGYNTNSGQEIHLRLRTDDMKGFRDMESVRHVLSHELAHNEISEHNVKFKELMREIEREVASVSGWMRKGGKVVEDGGLDGGGGRAGPVGVDPLQEGMAAVAVGPRRLGGLGGLSRLVEEAAVVKEVAKEDAVMEEKVAVKEVVVEEKVVKEAVEKPKSAKSILTEMGFHPILSNLALRENQENVMKASNWLFCQQQESGHENNVELDPELSTRIREFERNLDRIEKELSREDGLQSLNTLHIYLGNLARHPENDRFSHIKRSNRGFHRAVGRFECAVDALRSIGFLLSTPHDIWRIEVSERNVSGVWIAKEKVEQRMIASLL